VKLHDVGEVIAVRKFCLADDPAREVVLKLGKPRPFPDTPEDQDSFCPFQITGAGDERVRYAAGVDAFQAIQLTLKLIRVVLTRLNEDLGGKLTWTCDESEGFGFPES